MSTAAERQAHVTQMNANQSIEGLEPDAADKEIQAKYVAGTASIADLLKSAQQFADQARADQARAGQA
jgi:hypothetical protein